MIEHKNGGVCGWGKVLEIGVDLDGDTRLEKPSCAHYAKIVGTNLLRLSGTG